MVVVQGQGQGQEVRDQDLRGQDLREGQGQGECTFHPLGYFCTITTIHMDFHMVLGSYPRNAHTYQNTAAVVLYMVVLVVVILSGTIYFLF